MAYIYIHIYIYIYFLIRTLEGIIRIIILYFGGFLRTQIVVQASDMWPLNKNLKKRTKLPEGLNLHSLLDARGRHEGRC